MNASAPIPESRPNEERANEPSMEEILASIRRIIADDQVLPLTPRPTPEPPKPSSGDGSSRPMPPGRSDAGGTAHGRERDTGSARDAEAPAVRPPIPRDRSADAARTRPEAPVRRQDDPTRAGDVAGRRRPDIADPSGIEASLAARLRSVIDSREEQPPRAGAPVPPAPAAAPPNEVSFSERADDPAGKLLSPASQASVASSFQALAATAHSETIDATVREMLRPMLKQWLDDNLPALVERLVRAEIERVARGGR